MLRTGKTQQYRREAAPVAEGRGIAPPGFARCKTEAICPRDFVRAGKSRHACINRETGQLLVALLIFRSGRLRSRPLHSQNRPDSLMVAHRKVSDHRPNRSTACRWRFTLAPENARHSAALIRPDVGKAGRALRCAPGASRPDAPTSGQRAASLSCRMLPGHYTTHIVRDPSVIYSGRTGNPETLCWK